MVVYQNMAHIAAMLVLLGCSAFFSASETAFFNLSRRQLRQLTRPAQDRIAALPTLVTQQGLEQLVALLLRNPGLLLGSLLLANCGVNICFFSLSIVLAAEIGSVFGPTAAAVSALLSFVVLVLLGEMLPKSLAYINPRRFSLAAAVPAFVLVRVLAPLQSVFNFLIVAPALRLLLGTRRKPKPVSITQLKLLIESSRQQGLITAAENRLLTEAVEFGFLKVRHVARPRVDMPACDVNAPPCRARALMTERKLTKLPVYSATIDNIVGLVYLRDLLLQPQVSLDRLVRKAHFVPEQKTVESLLEFFRHNATDIAIVVDEYGGICGYVCIEDIVEELVGPVPGQLTEPIQQIGPMTYRLPGNLPIHDWADAFGIHPAATRLSTIGGLVTALLGRIPRPGDTAHLKNLKFTVQTMQKNRIEAVILSVEGISE
jgi:putative hemolysin